MKNSNFASYPRTFSGLLEDFFGEQGQLNKLKDEFVDNMPKLTKLVPPVNIKETNTGYDLSLIVPGIPKDQINIEVKEDLLIVSHDATGVEQAEEKYLKQEFKLGSFKRTFSLSETLDADNIAARFDNGILFITVPKKTENQKIHKVISID